MSDLTLMRAVLYLIIARIDVVTNGEYKLANLELKYLLSEEKLSQL